MYGGMMGPDLIVDLDCFFASVEQQLVPSLQGRPIGVVPVLADSTSCIAVSKEAKRCGVKTGTGVREARQLCPEIAFVLSRPAIYLEFHHRFVAALESRLTVAEVMSIDEAWCLLPRGVRTRAEAERFARELKRSLTQQVGGWLTYSIGIAPNRFLAKLASDQGKPDGVFIIEQADLPHCLHSMELRDFCGIGKNMEARLRAHGIQTVAQLTAASRETLHHVWGGIGGVHFWHWLRGESTEGPPTQKRVIGHSHVLPRHLRHRAGTRAVVDRLLQKAAMRLRKMDYHTSRLEAFVKYTDGTHWAADIRFTETQDTFLLLEALETLWKQLPVKPAVEPRATGVNLSGLVPASSVTPSLLQFDRRHDQLCGLVDAINKRYGKNAICFGGALGALDRSPMRIAFTRIPDAETES
jgi:DNA polymerase-4